MNGKDSRLATNLLENKKNPLDYLLWPCLLYKQFDMFDSTVSECDMFGMSDSDTNECDIFDTDINEGDMFDTDILDSDRLHMTWFSVTSLLVM